MLGSDRTNVTIVIPIFDPPDDLAMRVDEILRQAAKVIVVDDNPGRNRDWKPANSDPRVLVLKHPTNQGIAAALNTGVREALKEPLVTHIITLDEDSRLCPGYVDDCLRRAEILSAQGETVGILCPETMDHRPVAARRGAPMEPFDPMQSGMFIPVDTFRNIGLFDETLFIDAVDSDYTLRARQHGLLVEFAPGTDLSHSLGRPVTAQFLGRTIRWKGKTKQFSSHSPVRLYYISRNHLRINLRFLSADFSWVVRRAAEDAKLIGINLLFGPYKEKSALAVLMGFAHAISGRSGKIPTSLVKRLASRAESPAR